jgi:parallel beta-helix repeat protein
MKSNSQFIKVFFIIWICSLIVLNGSSNLIQVASKNSTEVNWKVKSQGMASFWNLTGTYMWTWVYYNGQIETEEQYKTVAGILIDETLENFTWSKTAATYPWCSGSGTEEDPYVIEYVYIDGQFTGNIYLQYSNILIRNSKAYFIIRNCSLHKAGPNDNAGVYLHNTTNGIIYRNDLTYNHDGVHLFESHNNIISENEIVSNHSLMVGTGNGICLDGFGNGNGSCNNTVEDNIIINHYGGIGVWFSLNNTITRNFLNNTLFGHFPDDGIFLIDSNYSYVTYNVFAGDYADFPNPYGDYIINEQNCVGNVIDNNFGGIGTSATSQLRVLSSDSWFTLSNSNYNYIYGNILLKSTNQPIIPGYMIYLIFIVGLMSLIVISTILKKKVTFIIRS